LRNEIDVAIKFSQPLDEAKKHDAAMKTSLAVHFPSSPPSPKLEHVMWLPDGTLFLKWTGAVPPQAGETFYYKLTIPGGAGGFKSASGAAMKENVVVYLELEGTV
jgi:hypothetical protein